MRRTSSPGWWARPGKPAWGLFSLLLLLTGLLPACERPDPVVTIVATPGALVLPPTPPVTRPGAGANPLLSPPTPDANRPLDSVGLSPAGPTPTPFPTYVGTPTPDPTRPVPTAAIDTVTHLVRGGETLGYIAQLYDTTVDHLVELNQIDPFDFLIVGQALQVPGRAPVMGPAFKILPDSELVYGPAARDLDIRAFLAGHNSHLLRYGEEVEGRYLEGPEIVALVAERFSVNPRLLLAFIEHQSGWVSRARAEDDIFMLGFTAPRHAGLYNQLSRAADAANWGFYGRAEANVTSLTLPDESRYTFAPGINDGTAGAQVLLAAPDSVTAAVWENSVGPAGFFATYSRLFGNPFAYTHDPLWPVGLSQPPLLLPWPEGETWFFTGGPHGGWASGSAWAALDFVPGGDQLGCYDSDAWVTAMAAGLVTRSDFGAVVLDLDGDGFAGTGWAIITMHVAALDRVPAGTYVNAGDRLGHPSCEGGFSNGTHIHVSRTYNGRWVSADGLLPFEMSGWVSQGLGREYDGQLVRGGETREACECREPENAVTR